MDKTFWWVYGRAGENLCEEGVTKEVSTGMGGRVILPGCLREKIPFGGTDYREIYWIQTNVNNV